MFLTDTDVKKSILVHLRLGDVKDRPDYNGETCGNYYTNRINNDDIYLIIEFDIVITIYYYLIIILLYN